MKLEPSIKKARRSWRRSIAAKLLGAFIVIATLTAMAALVAVLQFGNIEAAMGRLTGVSLLAVKNSLVVETNSRSIAAGGAQLASADSEEQRFARMSESTERISVLWSALSQLRSVAGEGDTIDRLQTLIATIDERLGQLDRTIAEKLMNNDSDELKYYVRQCHGMASNTVHHQDKRCWQDLADRLRGMVYNERHSKPDFAKLS